ncbi:MAG: hypothetical protein MUF68_08055 [Cyclobacteriaceae bacterium]|jgi:hypothetical protein|nr:hypothetical protein [Cyclobacteriaceae bacterium]
MNTNWIVIDENPRPDNYIAILESEININDRKISCKHIVCVSKEEAILTAYKLKKKYDSDRIKLFSKNGISENIE